MQQHDEVVKILRGGQYVRGMVRLAAKLTILRIEMVVLPRLEEEEPDPAERWEKLRALFGRQGE
jgi:hypothetical protein